MTRKKGSYEPGVEETLGRLKMIQRPGPEALGTGLPAESCQGGRASAGGGGHSPPAPLLLPSCSPPLLRLGS